MNRLTFLLIEMNYYMRVHLYRDLMVSWRHLGVWSVLQTLFCGLRKPRTNLIYVISVAIIPSLDVTSLCRTRVS